MTALLYFIIILIPFNYYYAKQSIDGMRNDAATMERLVFVSGALQYLAITDKSKERSSLIKKVDATLKEIAENFIHFEANAQYVALFKADEDFNALANAYVQMKDSSEKPALAYNAFKEVYIFSKTAQEMMDYKVKTILDKLYLSLTFTMIGMVALIFLIRMYIKLQLRKHSVHDHVTGLYNKKYFNHTLEHAQLLAVRQEHPLSLITLSIVNYDLLNRSLEQGDFETYLNEFSGIFHDFFRHSDTVCRIEEDCLAVIMPDAPPESMASITQKLQQRIEIRFHSSHLYKNLTIDIRIGVAVYSKENTATFLDEAKSKMAEGELLSMGTQP
jgi:diguanylate cyclase (GGDEF)-like protein